MAITQTVKTKRIQAPDFMKKYNFIVGVPCSKLKDLTDEIKNYIPCTREDEAMALAVGAHLVGKKPLVFLQNSGLGNIVDIITSLLKPYGIKVDLLISVRNKPEQHAFMGKITKKLLKLLEYKNYKLVIQK
jgi:phosphonopyruvate decarboxylase